MESKSYRIGLILIVLSFIACIISYYLVYFAIPFFLIGSTIVFFSKTDLKRKILTVFLPILLWIPSSIIFLYIYGYSTPETYLIPKSVKNGFRVIYEEKCGIEPKMENRRRVIVIPENGIAILNFKNQSGWNNHEYFSVDLKGNRIKIGDVGFANSEESIVKSVSSGIMSGTSLDGSLDIHYSDFIIKKNKNDSEWMSNSHQESKIDSSTRVLVEKCRTNK